MTLVRYAIAFVLGIALVTGLWVAQSPPSVEVITSRWSASGHADRTSVSFTRWDGDDPPIIPVACAKCHSATGFLDFVGEDGSTPGVVDRAAPIGSVVSCQVCHNNTTHEMTLTRFPSGDEIETLVSEATCLHCHQGRASSVTVAERIAGLDLDTVSDQVGFVNVHYAVAAATQMGAQAQGMYQYAGKEYVGRFVHVDGLKTCTQCHDTHSLVVDYNKCSPCHLNMASRDDFPDIRVSRTDHDGDGDIKEGISYEIKALQAELYASLQTYAAQVIGAPIAYNKEAFPYFFADTNANGVADPEESNFGNQYRSWTPRLARVAYNYHFVNEDHGIYAHNPRYVLQVLYDSLEDMSERVSVDMARFTRP